VKIKSKGHQALYVAFHFQSKFTKTQVFLLNIGELIGEICERVRVQFS
jgi:hypothetical protein